MANFLQSHFYLNTPAARELYDHHAAPLPVVDFHCHLSPEVFAVNEAYSEITDLWISSDPYKWRAMRLNGIPERVITGDASAQERFAAWADTLPQLAGNPLYHWSHLELKRFFGINEFLSPANAEMLRKACNERLLEPEFRPQSLLQRSGIEIFVTSDDWLDELEHHFDCRGQGIRPRMFPSLRADAALAVDQPGYRHWLVLLGARADVEIKGLDTFRRALCRRLDLFAEAGCVLADHGIDTLFFAETGKAEALFQQALEGDILRGEEAAMLKTWIFLQLTSEYAHRGWTLQLHIGAHRATSRRLRELSGAAGSYATIGPCMDTRLLCSLLDAMESGGGLPRTILYPLNPNDYEAVACVTGSFAEDGIPGKLQLGPAWWYNDHRGGIERNLEAVSAYSMLGHFIGMTTDSRSFLSGVRHEYFRRIFCGWMGRQIEAGELPADMTYLGGLVEAVCHDNAAALFTTDVNK